MLLPDGRWVLGPGDSSEEIRAIKAFMRRKFAGYAGHLADTTLYDQEMYLAVLQMEQNYAKERPGVMANGFIGASTKILMGYMKAPPPKKLPQLHTVVGTGVPGDFAPDPTNQVGQWLKDNHLADWWWVGYPAQPFPMWPSILSGATQLVTDIQQRSVPGDDIWGCGYSQGACVWSVVYKYHFLPVDGLLHNRLPDLKKVWMFENPMREEGQQGGNVFGGYPLVEANTAGALEDLMIQTPGYWKESVNPKDLYADVLVGPGWGEGVRAICKIVMGNHWWSGGDSIFAQLAEIGINPFSEGWSTAQTVLKAGMFFGGGLTPHTQNLHVGNAIDYFRAA